MIPSKVGGVYLYIFDPIWARQVSGESLAAPTFGLDHRSFESFRTNLSKLTHSNMQCNAHDTRSEILRKMPSRKLSPTGPWPLELYARFRPSPDQRRDIRGGLNPVSCDMSRWKDVDAEPPRSNDYDGLIQSSLSVRSRAEQRV